MCDNKYKINLHAHSLFSDGINTPYVMALEAKRLGFSSLVITDHFYGENFSDVSITKDKYALLYKACVEANYVLPVIIGLEVPMCDQEVLVFGTDAVKRILNNGLPTKEDIIEIKLDTNCGLILCHPGEDFDDIADVVDGFEEYNCGQNLFDDGDGLTRPFGSLSEKQRWCNSDAHSSTMLDWCYNIIDSKIENENDLINYIKQKNQPDFFIKDF